MSRIGNNPVKLPAKVEVTLANGEIKVKGPLGELSRNYGDSVTIEKDGERRQIASDHIQFHRFVEGLKEDFRL